MKQTQNRYSYPASYHRMALSFRRGGVVTLIVGIAGMLLGLMLIFVPKIPITIVSFVVAFWTVIAWCGWTGWTKPPSVSVVPFFANPVGKMRTFGHGVALARNFGAVDDLARLLGVMPFSDFGITTIEPTKATPFPCSDYRPDIWLDAADVLPTLTALVAALRENQFLLGATETPLVLADLERIMARLEVASMDGVPFRFLLRYGDSVSGVESVFDYGYF